VLKVPGAGEKAYTHPQHSSAQQKRGSWLPFKSWQKWSKPLHFKFQVKSRGQSIDHCSMVHQVLPNRMTFIIMRRYSGDHDDKAFRLLLPVSEKW
jgi:hypothetical protein